MEAANGLDRSEAYVILVAEIDYRNFDLKTEMDGVSAAKIL